MSVSVVVPVTYHLELRNETCYVVLTCRRCGKQIHEMEVPKMFPSGPHDCTSEEQKKLLFDCISASQNTHRESGDAS